MRRALLALLSSVTLSPAALAEGSPFDGAWTVTLTCPAHAADGDDAKGYTHVFDGSVRDGRLEATHGSKDQPGWHLLQGRIEADGSAALRLDGVVNNPQYAIKDAPQGKRYTYRVKARFEADAGQGERLTGRACHFEFARRR